MKRHSLAAAGLLLLGWAFSPASLAHPGAHSLLGIEHGPVHLGINLGSLIHQRHRRAHHHGPRCYRRYPSGHGHWGGRRHHDRDWHDRGWGHGDHHARDRGHRGHHRHHHRPRHVRRGHGSGHRHSRDCRLHYGRGHAHWK